MLKHTNSATGSDIDRDSDQGDARDHDIDHEAGLDASDDDEGGDAEGEDPRPIVRRARAKTIAMKRLTKEELRIGALLYPERSYWRPKTRGECANVPRPCPYVSCKHHLYIDVNPATGSIKINFPDLEVWELRHSCALDVAQGGGITLEEVGEILNLTRERIRQVEVRGLLKLKEAGGEDLLSYLAGGEG
ncbi:MAG TPA: sigma factor-like helix-turn-helix DNA-binding protein [Nannocystis sp.]